MEIVQVPASRAFPRRYRRRSMFDGYGEGYVDWSDRVRVTTEIYEHVTSVLGRAPIIQIRRSNRSSSSGRAFGSYLIQIRAGANIKDIQNVMVHEVTHTMNVGQKHSPLFYRSMFANIKKCGYDLDYSIQREGNYKSRNSKKAARAAKRAA